MTGSTPNWEPTSWGVLKFYIPIHIYNPGEILLHETVQVFSNLTAISQSSISLQ